MRKPLIDSENRVVNIIEISADAIYTPPDGLTMLGENEAAIIGGSYDPATDTYSPPPDIEPETEADPA